MMRISTVLERNGPKRDPKRKSRQKTSSKLLTTVSKPNISFYFMNYNFSVFGANNSAWKNPAKIYMIICFNTGQNVSMGHTKTVAKHTYPHTQRTHTFAIRYIP